MEYRSNRRTGDRISVLGFGTSYIANTAEKDAVETIQKAYEGGVNYFDLATQKPEPFPISGQPWVPSEGMCSIRSISAQII